MTSPDKKSARWLRRHWYVPVIGAAIVYTLIDESADSICNSLDCGCNQA